MPNKLLNATGLDGATNWVAPPGGALSVDEAVMGAPGRIVIRSDGVYIYQIAPAIPAGATKVWAFAHIPPGAYAYLEWVGGPSNGFTVIVPLVQAGDGRPRRGLPGTFDLVRVAAVPIPTGATGYLLVVNKGTGTDAAVLKPYASTDGPACSWQPGGHANIDLSYPAWPTDLPAIMDEGLQADPIATRKGFSGDSGVESTRRITRARRVRLTAQLALTIEEYDRLMQFFDDTEGPFWFTRPGTHEVCLAQWLADGEPVLAGRLPGRRRVQIKLQLRVP